MKVRVSAAGLLEDYLPADSDGETTVEIPDAPPAATLLTVMHEAGIPESASPLIALNGVVVPRGSTPPGPCPTATRCTSCRT